MVAAFLVAAFRVAAFLVAAFRVAAFRICAQRRCAAVAMLAFGLVVAPVITPWAPARAVQPVASAFNSNDTILKWINGYRHRPDPDRLPAVVHALSAMQAFKVAE